MRKWTIIANNNSAGTYAVAMGYSTTASGSYSTAMGDTQQQVDMLLQQWDIAQQQVEVFYSNGKITTASGDYSTAMGDNTTASDYGSLVIGQYNSSGSSVTNSATSFSTSNTAFVIGNGADSSNKSDAFKVMFNGDATVSNDLNSKWRCSSFFRCKT